MGVAGGFFLGEDGLGIPAAILVDRRGIVRFVHADPDYKNRVDTGTLLDMARQVAGSSR